MSSDTTRSVDQLRVLTFGTFIAGSMTALVLAELGADVVKIEPLARPEVLRSPPYSFGDGSVVEPSGVPNTVMYADLSRSTRNLSLEMNTEDGRALFKRLVAVADVVIENFGAGTMAHWNCSFDELIGINPRLVMVSLSGYGRTGPRGTYLAYATNISNFSGLTTTWTYQHGTHSDYITGIHAANAVLAAIAQVDHTGTGVAIDVAQTEALGAVLAPLYLDPLNNGRDTPAVGNAVPGSMFTGVFACHGHDRWLAIELEDLSDWSTLCAVLGRPDLVVRDDAGIDARRRELHDAIAGWSRAQSPHTAAQLLQNAGLAAGAVYDSEDIVRDPQLRARGAAVELDQPDLGVIEYYQSPYRMTKTPGFARWAGPRLGQHTATVLREWLELDDREIAALEASNAVFQAPSEAS
jgi:benzylsuccinate CoA-transferase BbsF subunit